jgi:23S rRNA (cytidine1920-2'-O)/16S rRNA (cytidine1409-2'-O)-methyltransferase
MLLEAGCRRVFAVDVGHGQIDPRVAQDPRVTSLEGVNTRNLTWDDLGGEVQGGIDCVVSDLSFISLKLALPRALSMVRPGGWGIFLIKPQFELGPEHVGKGGIVRDAQMQDHCAMDLANWLDTQAGWRHTDLVASPIEGGSGNREFLLGGIKDTQRKS